MVRRYVEKSDHIPAFLDFLRNMDFFGFSQRPFFAYNAEFEGGVLYFSTGKTVLFDPGWGGGLSPLTESPRSYESFWVHLRVSNAQKLHLLCIILTLIAISTLDLSRVTRRRGRRWKILKSKASLPESEIARKVTGHSVPFSVTFIPPLQSRLLPRGRTAFPVL